MGKKRPLEPVPSPSSSEEEEEKEVEDRMEEDKGNNTSDETEEEESDSDSDSDSDRPSPSPSASKLKPVSPPPPAKIPGSGSVSHQSAAAKKKGGGRSVENAKTDEKIKASEVGKAAEKAANAKKKGGSSVEKAKAAQKGKEKAKAAKKGKATEKGKAAEKGKASEKVKASDKGKASEEGKAAEKGKAAEEAKAAEKGNASEEANAAEKGKAAATTPLFQRVWSEEDELALLRGMIEYKAQKGRDPYADLGDFYEFVKKAFHFDASRNQLVAKIKRLKGRYQRNAANGKRPVSSNPHEVKLFELSGNIWQVDASTIRPPKRAKSGRVKIEDSGKVGEVKIEAGGGLKRKEDVDAAKNTLKEYPLLNASLNEMEPELRFGGSVLLRDEFGWIGKSLMDELETEWKKLKHDEVGLIARKNALIAKQIGLVLGAIKY